ncbi:MAG: nicotinate-nucleotide adenylyltransferase [Methylicorpusculum sp.]|uniref:nicotinate-nucleotide adenylyltransferase n=1 Tax=Methylicorpusculum sp. TaxID=2713644 RepID=UPI002722398B|nr:nicotinate-nucleotide adenylyltransferase [Methylicorpusculum sp.]MDO8938074.1 nicotinate-nucleotide adenylyltransferase [Methylicorpusculum sp.]MDO9240910.1 nicotinate-nucleotide adenylyltransferase [Methylicorpusculum sp.]MDP2202183.1 nicotinate-nucleotide adenylyltransferase [Methylicorpusculum sp.]
MLGVYGGTFDPVHFGHLRTALEVKELFKLDEIRLIPCFIPAHRDEPSVAADMRVRMLELALAGQSGMTVDTREIDRGGSSYMVDTLASLRETLAADRPLLLFIGSDAFEHLCQWYRWQALFDYAHVVVMTRPGSGYAELNEVLKQRYTDSIQKLKDTACGSLFFQRVTLLDISATAIRQMVAEGRNPGFLLPDAVINYIDQNQLYRR